MKKILIATKNKNKLKEIKQILKNYEIISLEDIKYNIDIQENGNTFEENSLKKAKEISNFTGYPCIADDSGLCIDIFDDWPGVFTSRFLGKNSTDIERNEYILNKMKNKTKEQRNAQFVCVITYYYRGESITEKGVLKGKISQMPIGNNGFGFDEIFELEQGKTLAQLSDEEKNKLSARKIALEKLRLKLEDKNFIKYL